MVVRGATSRWQTRQSRAPSLTLGSWRVYRFRVAATDSAGRLGAWSAESRIRVRQALQTEATASYSGAWPRKASVSFLEGATRSRLRRGIPWNSRSASVGSRGSRRKARVAAERRSTLMASVSQLST